PTQTYLKFFSFHSHLHPYHNLSLLKQIPNIHSSNIPPNPTHHHSNIFQKVLANAFLLFTRSAAKY
ncbi:TPA: hypothetical protein ACHJAV_005250, partial [Klebsiella pneumoniae]